MYSSLGSFVLLRCKRDSISLNIRVRQESDVKQVCQIVAELSAPFHT
jgi:hypothetical protein